MNLTAKASAMTGAMALSLPTKPSTFFVTLLQLFAVNVELEESQQFSQCAAFSHYSRVGAWDAISISRRRSRAQWACSRSSRLQCSSSSVRDTRMWVSVKNLPDVPVESLRDLDCDQLAAVGVGTLSWAWAVASLNAFPKNQQSSL